MNMMLSQVAALNAPVVYYSRIDGLLLGDCNAAL